MASHNRYGLPDASIKEICVQKAYVVRQHVLAPGRRDYVTVRADLLMPQQPGNDRTQFLAPPDIRFTPGRRVTQVRQGGFTTITDVAYDAPRMRNR